MRLSRVFAACVMLAAPTVVSAEESGWRTNVVVGGGVSVARGGLTYDDWPSAPVVNGRETHATNWGGRIYAGAMLADSFVAKVEANYQYFDFNDTLTANADTDLATAFLVGQLRLPSPGLVRPYLEAGVGAAYVRLVGDEEISPAIKGAIGFDFSISKNASIFAQAEYTYIDDIQVTDVNNRTGDFSIDYFSFVVGANSYF